VARTALGHRQRAAVSAIAPLTSDDVVGITVGDLQRIRVYATKGYQIAQEIPDDVWQAFEELVRAGYVKYLVCR
jgi:hypothetical protein